MTKITEKAKKYFLEIAAENQKGKYFTLIEHVPKVEKWALKIANNYPEADKEVLLTSVWLHDIGFYKGTSEDHSVNSEKIAKEFLDKLSYEESKTEKVAHCVRAHRCNDVLPSTIEAEILAFSDSASHFVSFVYLDFLRMWGKEKALKKLQRDWRDVNRLPEGKDLKNLYISWRKLLKAMPEWVFDFEEEQNKVVTFVER